jgi:uncharacterized protein (DUF2062 family)
LPRQRRWHWLRAARALKTAGLALGAGSQYVPLGDNQLLLAQLCSRVKSSRVAGS